MLINLLFQPLFVNLTASNLLLCDKPHVIPGRITVSACTGQEDTFTGPGLTCVGAQPKLLCAGAMEAVGDLGIAANIRVGR